VSALANSSLSMSFNSVHVASRLGEELERGRAADCCFFLWKPSKSIEARLEESHLRETGLKCELASMSEELASVSEELARLREISSSSFWR
jgi:hypothetical protein